LAGAYNSNSYARGLHYLTFVERSANPSIERMLNVFDLHLSAPEEKAVPRICASKTWRNLQTFGWCFQFKQSCPWASLSFFCTQKTTREINAKRPVILRKNVSEKLSIINPLLKEEKPLQFEFTNIAAKKPQPLLCNGIEKGAGEKGKSVTTSP
jgi:hypothetical protein